MTLLAPSSHAACHPSKSDVSQYIDFKADFQTGEKFQRLQGGGVLSCVLVVVVDG